MEQHLRAEEGEFWKLRDEIWDESCILIGALHDSSSAQEGSMNRTPTVLIQRMNYPAASGWGIEDVIFCHSALDAESRK